MLFDPPRQLYVNQLLCDLLDESNPLQSEVRSALAALASPFSRKGLHYEGMPFTRETPSLLSALTMDAVQDVRGRWSDVPPSYGSMGDFMVVAGPEASYVYKTYVATQEILGLIKKDYPVTLSPKSHAWRFFDQVAVTNSMAANTLYSDFKSNVMRAYFGSSVLSLAAGNLSGLASTEDAIRRESARGVMENWESDRSIPLQTLLDHFEWASSEGDKAFVSLVSLPVLAGASLSTTSARTILTSPLCKCLTPDKANVLRGSVTRALRRKRDSTDKEHQNSPVATMRLL